MSGTDLTLGRVGIWASGRDATPDRARLIERLGFGTLWIGSSPSSDLVLIESLLDATTSLVVATGIVTIWDAPAEVLAASYRRVAARHPDRFLLGIGAAHPEFSGERAARPLGAMAAYLDGLDTEGVPENRRVLAALGPKMLHLAATRTAGAHPYLVDPEYTRRARAILGAGPLLAPEQRVVVGTDAVTVREVARRSIAQPYLELENYRRNLRDSGFTEADLDDGGSDRLVDALAAGPGAIASRVAGHLGAGADHVCLQVLPVRGADADEEFRMLAAEVF